MPTVPSTLARLLADSPLRALDVGAAGGLPPHWRPYASCLRVDAFEPDPEAFERQRAVETGPVQWFPVGLAGTSGRRPFYILNRSTGSSLLPPNEEVLQAFATPDYYGVRKVIEIDCLSFADYLDDYHRPVPELVKLDTQGSELEILSSLREDQWEGVLFVETEVEFLELYKGQPQFCDVHAFMTERGFRLLDLRTHRSYHVRGGRRNGYLRDDLGAAVGSKRLSAQLVAGDALYARPPSDARVTATPRALAAYVLSALVYRYHDLVFQLLDRPEVSRVLSEAEIVTLRREVRSTAPKPRPWERAVLPLELARKAWHRFVPSRIGYQAFWTRRRWPDQ